MTGPGPHVYMHRLAEQARTGPREAALASLEALDELPGDDLARPDYHAAAITFALLEVASCLAGGSGGSIASVLEHRA